MRRFADPIDGVIPHTAGTQGGRVRCVLEGAALTARDASGQTTHAWIGCVHTTRKIYRVSVDDGIWFRQDPARHACGKSP